MVRSSVAAIRSEVSKSARDAITPELLGATGSGTLEDTQKIQRALDKSSSEGKPFVLSGGKTWQLQTALQITSRAHVIVEAGAIVKFHDDAVMNDTSLFEASQNTATNYSFPIFNIRTSDASRSVFELYGTFNTNQNEVDGNSSGNRQITRVIFNKSANNILVFGNWLIDNCKCGIYLVDCDNCHCSGFHSEGNTVDITLGEKGALFACEGTNNCWFDDFSYELKAGNSVIAEAGDWNTSCFGGGVSRGARIKGINGSSDEVFDINGCGGIHIGGVTFVNCRKPINYTTHIPSNGHYTDRENQELYIRRHTIGNIRVVVEGGESWDITEPMIDTNGGPNMLISWESIFIEFTGTHSGTISATEAVILNTEDGESGSFTFTSDNTNEFNNVLNLDFSRGFVGAIRINATIGENDSLMVLDGDSSRGVFGELDLRQNTLDTTTSRTGLEMLSGVDNMLVHKNFIENVATNVSGWAATDNNLFMSGTFVANTTVLTNSTRGSAGNAGRVIFNSDDGQLNIDDGTNWTLPDGTTT